MKSLEEILVKKKKKEKGNVKEIYIIKKYE